MVLFSIHLRPHTTCENLKTQLQGTGIHAQKITLKGIFIHLKHGTNSGVQIPNSLYVELDFLGNSVHNASSPLTDGGEDYPHVNSLICPLNNTKYTQITGLDITFNVNGKIDRDIISSIKNFNSSNELVVTNATNTVEASLDAGDTKSYLTSLILLFEYNKVGNF